MKTSGPFISIVIPVYNTGRFLSTCIDSVLRQSIKAYEIILIDDGSTDSSAEICDVYAKKNGCIKVLHQKNNGLAAARNVGFLMASGSYLLFLDSDDYYTDPHLLENLLHFAENKKPDIVCFRSMRVMDDTQFIITPKSKAIITDSSRLVAKNIYQSSACNKMVSMDFAKQFMPLFEVGRLSEDVLYSGRILSEARRVGYYPAEAYGYRIRQDSITAKISNKHFTDLLFAVKKLDEMCVNMRENESLWGYSAFQFCTLLINWRRAGSPNDSSQLEQIKTLSHSLAHGKYYIVRLVHICYCLLGARGTSWLLQLWYQLTHWNTRRLSFGQEHRPKGVEETCG